MLSNKDFAKLLSTPSGSGGGGSKDKERFDLKTIKQWDNQIKAKMKNQHRDQDDWEDDGGGLSRSKGKGGGSSGVSRAGTGDTSASSAYRDRALERRLEANPDYAVSFEAAAKMDVDTSKYFGGDAEHTHLVKGLDHALLQKMKQQKQISTTPMTVHNRDSTKASHEYVPATELGARLKQVLHMHSARTGPTVGTRSGSSTAAPSRPRAPLSILPCAPAARNAYEVELDVLSEQDVPTTVLRSAKVGAYRSCIDSCTYTCQLI
jgi:IK cytokine